MSLWEELSESSSMKSNRWLPLKEELPLDGQLPSRRKWENSFKDTKIYGTAS